MYKSKNYNKKLMRIRTTIVIDRMSVKDPVLAKPGIFGVLKKLSSQYAVRTRITSTSKGIFLSTWPHEKAIFL
jgi:hypothetical protein